MDNEVLLSVITGGFMLVLIIPMALFLYQITKENDRLNEAKRIKKPDTSVEKQQKLATE
jgi:hypothetical protein